MAIQFTDNKYVLNAVAVTTTSAGEDVSKRQQISVQFVATGISSGNGVFTIDATNDAAGGTWTTGVAFKDAVGLTNTQYVTSKTLSANGSAIALVPVGFNQIRVKCAVTTDGTYSAVLQTGG